MYVSLLFFNKTFPLYSPLLHFTSFFRCSTFDVCSWIWVRFHYQLQLQEIVSIPCSKFGRSKSPLWFGLVLSFFLTDSTDRNYSKLCAFLWITFVDQTMRSDLWPTLSMRRDIDVFLFPILKFKSDNFCKSKLIKFSSGTVRNVRLMDESGQKLLRT